MGRNIHLGKRYVLHLYFAGRSPRATLAMTNLKKLCCERLAERCDVKFIDLYEHPSLAKKEKIVAIPTLIKKSPGPERRIIGDLSDVDRVLSGLEL